MKISYAIPVCNENVEIQRLVSFLLEHKRDKDEIIILFDSTNGTKSVEDYLRAKSVNGGFSWHPYQFNGDFSKMKNRLNLMCNGDYVFQIDADEMITEHLIDILPQILKLNRHVDLYRVPRLNHVKGLTQEHIQKWGWYVDDRGRVNWPDVQWRIYRNDPRIKWEGKVHEKIVGHSNHSILPLEEEWALEHFKTIERQERQNNYYDKL